MHKIVLRFDVDTVKCARRGMPALLDLASKHQVPMAFYVNMGRSVDLGAALRRRARRQYKSSTSAPKKGIVEKLGLWHVMYSVLLNPKVGSSIPEVLKRIVEEGHELGLHGGRNHGTWQADARSWSEERTRREIEWGMEAMRSLGLPAPVSFASPGWNAPPCLEDVLSRKGFSVLVDSHNTNLGVETNSQSKIKNINTNLLGEPGGIGWFEWMDAKGAGYSDLLGALISTLERHGSAMLYDHPAYMLSKMDVFENLLIDINRMGVEFLTPLSWPMSKC